MYLSLLLLLGLGFGESPDARLRELVYQAEVYGHQRESLAELRTLLDGANAERQRQITWAMAMVKFRQPRPADADALIAALARPYAVLSHKGMSQLLVGERWLELGDWLGSNFLADIQADRILLQNRDGFQQEVALLEPIHLKASDHQGIFMGAPIADVLSFIARNANLNSFLPSGMHRAVYGTYAISDWLGLLDQICRVEGIAWTRHGDNIIFTMKRESPSPAIVARETFTRKGQNLQSFLHWLSERFDLELVTEASAADMLDTRVDIDAQDQSWEETLDCLAVMNGFSWTKIDEEGRPKLVITRNP